MNPSNSVSFFDWHGTIEGEVLIPGAPIVFQDGRRSYQPATGLHWKGAGCPYQGHFSLHPAPDEVVLGKSLVFYVGYHVGSAAYLHKTGVFRRRYQPLFTDPIGGCGPKERLISDPARQRLSFVAAQVIAELETPWPDTKVYAIRYRGGRHSFAGDPLRLWFLLEQMLRTGWNFYWDKNAVGDLNSLAMVTDSADLFYSADPIHQFGTVYALFYSLRTACPQRYHDLVHHAQINPDLDTAPAARLALEVLCDRECWPDLTPRELIRTVLMAGRACAGAESPENEAAARQFYQSSLPPPPSRAPVVTP